MKEFVGEDAPAHPPLDHLPYTELRRPFDSACREAGIKGFRWHDLRHTFGTRLAEAGHSEATIAELMGHSDPKTTRRYTHGTERAKRAAVEATSLRGADDVGRRAELALVAR